MLILRFEFEKTFMREIKLNRLQIQMKKATSLLYTADYEESKIILDKLLLTYLSDHDVHGILRCYYRLAFISYARGEIEQFTDYTERYNALFTSFLAKDIEFYIEQNMLLGLQAMSNLKYSRAIPFLSSVVTHSSPKYKKYKISALLFIQNCQLTLGNIEQAEIINEQLREYEASMQGHTQQIIQLYLNRAYTYYLLEDDENLETLIAEIKSHPDISLLTKETIFLSILKAKHLGRKGEYIKAINDLESILNTYNKMRDPQLLYMIYSALIEYYEQIQNHKEALYFAKLLMALERELSLH